MLSVDRQEEVSTMAGSVAGLGGSARTAQGPASPHRTGAGSRWEAVFARSGFTTWAPRRRTHLLCLLCSGLLTMLSTITLYPFSWLTALLVLASGLGLAVVSVWPLGGAVLCLVAACCSPTSSFPLPALGPWLCASVLVSRGFHRASAYGIATCGIVTAYAFHHLAPRPVHGEEYTQPFVEIYQYTFLPGLACLVVAELLRQPRQLGQAAAEQYEADLERQRLLVVSELHDTVVRDLSQAVMVAEQARLAHPEETALSPALASMTASVRASVEQLRAGLRSMSRARGAAGVDVLASSAPRPLSEVLAEARAVMAGRGVVLEVMGLELLEAGEVGPGVRQQLVRVLGELASNMAKYAAGGSPARLVLEGDGRSLEAMATNATAGADAGAEGSGPASPAVSSGLGLQGARRRVETLGGSFDVARGAERFTVVFSVPLTAAGG